MGLFDFLTGGKTINQSYAQPDTRVQSLLEQRAQDAAKSAMTEGEAQANQIAPMQAELMRTDTGIQGIAPETIHAAMQDRARQTSENDLRTLKQRLQVSQFGQIGNVQSNAFNMAKQKNAFDQGQAQARMRYDNDRRQLRQQAINGIIGIGATVVGGMAGGPAGAMAAQKVSSQQNNYEMPNPTMMPASRGPFMQT
jgi:hypothetical protein